MTGERKIIAGDSLTRTDVVAPYSELSIHHDNLPIGSIIIVTDLNLGKEGDATVVVTSPTPVAGSNTAIPVRLMEEELGYFEHRPFILPSEFHFLVDPFNSWLWRERQQRQPLNSVLAEILVGVIGFNLSQFDTFILVIKEISVRITRFRGGESGDIDTFHLWLGLGGGEPNFRFIVPAPQKTAGIQPRDFLEGARYIYQL